MTILEEKGAPPLVLPARKEPLWGAVVHYFGKRGTPLGEIRDPETRTTVAAYVGGLGITTVVSINGSRFNAEVIGTDPAQFLQHSEHEHDGVSIYSGAFADGVIGLSPGTGFWIRSADCPTVLLAGIGGEYAVVHAGKRSLLVEYWKPQFAALAERPSVLANALERMTTPRDKIRALVICGVGPKSYPHPTNHPIHGEHNRRLFKEVRARWGPQCIVRGESLSLVGLITAQLKEGGVSGNHIFWDSVDTVGQKNEWYSASRGDEGRNHVLILIPPR